jgi:hypothetical protein
MHVVLLGKVNKSALLLWRRRARAGHAFILMGRAMVISIFLAPKNAELCVTMSPCASYEALPCKAGPGAHRLVTS